MLNPVGVNFASRVQLKWSDRPHCNNPMCTARTLNSHRSEQHLHFYRNLHLICTLALVT